MNNYIALILVIVAVIAGGLYAIKRRKKRKDRFENEVLPPRLIEALELVKYDNDFSTVTIISSDLIDDHWGEYRSGIIAIDRTFINTAPIGKIACVLIHELAHHQGKTEEEATLIGKECYKKFE